MKDNLLGHYSYPSVFHPNLTRLEWAELLALEYVLTWGYADDVDKDTKRLIELRKLGETK